MKILKFGGSSVATPETIKQVAFIIQENYSRGEKFSFVVSAFGGVTDKLLGMAQIASTGNESFEEEWVAVKQRHLDVVASLLSNNFKKEAEIIFRKEFSKSDYKKIKIIHALIWFSLSGYAKDDIDTILAAFYLGTYWMNEAIG